MKKLKKSLKPNAGEVLIFQDEVEIHVDPMLPIQCARLGQQPDAMVPGENEKKFVYGGVDYGTGKVTCTVAVTQCGTEFLAFLILLFQDICRAKNPVGLR